VVELQGQIRKMGSSTMDAMQVLFTAFDTGVSSVWHEEDRSWRSEDRQWRAEDIDYRGEERIWREEERGMRNNELRYHHLFNSSHFLSFVRLSHFLPYFFFISINLECTCHMLSRVVSLLSPCSRGMLGLDILSLHYPTNGDWSTNRCQTLFSSLQYSYL
jgi:hypothetical protein